jgi:hypothetical protein
MYIMVLICCASTSVFSSPSSFCSGRGPKHSLDLSSPHSPPSVARRQAPYENGAGLAMYGRVPLGLCYLGLDIESHEESRDRQQQPQHERHLGFFEDARYFERSVGFRRKAGQESSEQRLQTRSPGQQTDFTSASMSMSWSDLARRNFANCIL